MELVSTKQGWDWSPIKKEETCRTKIIQGLRALAHAQRYNTNPPPPPPPPPPQFYYRSGEVTKVTKKTPKTQKSANQRKNLISDKTVDRALESEVNKSNIMWSGRVWSKCGRGCSFILVIYRTGSFTLEVFFLLVCFVIIRTCTCIYVHTCMHDVDTPAVHLPSTGLNIHYMKRWRYFIYLKDTTFHLSVSHRLENITFTRWFRLSLARCAWNCLNEHLV